MSTAIVWFRRDLRLEDNPAWAAATEAHDEIVPALVIEPALLDTAGPHRRRAFLTAAEALDRSITELGGRLHVRIGDPVRILPALAEEADAAAVYANADVSRWAQRRDTAVESALGVSIEWHWGTLAHAGHRPHQGRHGLAEFHPFSKQWFAVPMRPEAVAHDIAVTTDPGDGLPASDGAESAVLAELRVDAWQADVDAYDDTRDLPAVDGTSRLSTALRFGTVSPITRRGVRHPLSRPPGLRSPAGVARLVRPHHPSVHRHRSAGDPPEYDGIAQTGPAADEEFTAWAEGRTGFPIVDAGMRQLAESGWMHNRVRMITASFLVKDLLIDWRRGERHFRHLLSDAEPSQNAGNWQWVAGTGPDAAPYFRIFNPWSQSRKFDASGDYIRRWVPELAGLDATTIHEPAAAATRPRRRRCRAR